MTRIAILGDSHTLYFRRELTLARVYHWEHFFQSSDCHVFQSASVKGFGNRSSTLGLAEKVAGTLPQSCVAVLNFGQVDIELGIFYRRFVKGERETPESFIDDCIATFT